MPQRPAPRSALFNNLRESPAERVVPPYILLTGLRGAEAARGLLMAVMMGGERVMAGGGWSGAWCSGCADNAPNNRFFFSFFIVLFEVTVYVDCHSPQCYVPFLTVNQCIHLFYNDNDSCILVCKLSRSILLYTMPLSVGYLGSVSLNCSLFSTHY